MKWISETDFRRWLPGVLLVLAAAFGNAEEADPVSIHVLRDQTYQRVEHFGASAAWWAQAVGTWPEASRRQVLDWLFDPVEGIGLNLVRYNLGAGKAGAGIVDPWRSAAAPGQDEAAAGIIDGAVARGASVLLFANSPPLALTVTGKPTGKGFQSNLKSGAEAAFARYLADTVQTLRPRWPLVAVSPINEPQWDWNPSKGQEGSFYSPEEAYRLTAAVVAEFRSRGLSLPISVIDSGEWSFSKNRAYIDQLASDPSLWPSLTPYAVHSYWSDVFDKEELAEYVRRKLPGLGLWQTEWTEMRAGRDPGMSAALTLAQVVHEDFTVGGVSSWQYWIAVSKYDYADGLLYADEAAQTARPTKKLWALGQWSRFIRPGAVRIGLDVDPSAGLLASAFRNPEGSAVVVLVNPSEDPSPLLDPGVSHPAGRWETSETRDLVDLGPVSGPFVLPPRSVTTLLYR